MRGRADFDAISGTTPMNVRRVSSANVRQSKVIGGIAIAFVLAAPATVWAVNREFLPGIQWQQPPVITPGESGGPPSDAIVLFDGTDMSAWENAENWTVADGVVTEGRGDVRTKQHFGDCQLHIEWSSPLPARGRGQGRGNSGIFFHDRYEIQVLDSYDNETYFEGQAGAIYKQMPPLVNAMRPPGEWNVYDVIWTSPKFNDDGSLASPAYVTALHNGVLILNHFELRGDTFWPTVPSYQAHGPGPIRLQDHGNPVRFRNIWVREFKPLTSERVHEPKFHDHDTGREWLVSEGETPPEESREPPAAESPTAAAQAAPAETDSIEQATRSTRSRRPWRPVRRWLGR
jgi:hypothetical protein